MKPYSTLVHCPSCDSILIPTHQSGNRFECPSCKGVASTTADIGMMLGTLRRKVLAEKARKKSMVVSMECPFCSTYMHQLDLRVRSGKITIETCDACQAVWMDHGEIVHLSSAELTQAGGSTPMDPSWMLDYKRRETVRDARYYAKVLLQGGWKATQGMFRLFWNRPSG